MMIFMTLISYTIKTKSGNVFTKSRFPDDDDGYSDDDADDSGHDDNNFYDDIKFDD